MTDLKSLDTPSGKQTSLIIAYYNDLCLRINRYNYQYHTLDVFLVSDYDYDNAIEELVYFEQKYLNILDVNNSPTKLVGGKLLFSFKVIKHKKKMLSLSNAFNDNDIKKFYTRLLKLTMKKVLLFECEPKMDGLAISVHYKFGIFFYAVTRGNGEYGEQVSINITNIFNIPRQLIGFYPKYFEIRGEIIINNSDFLFINTELKCNNKKEFSTPRNLVAGTVRQLEPDLAILKYLKMYAYDIGFTSPDFCTPKTQFDLIKVIKELGFQTCDNICVISQMTDCIGYYKHLRHLRSDLDYDIDGIIYKLNDIELQKKIGYISKAPRWSVAYKFPAKEVESEILKIDFQVGKSGILTPVARLKPVSVSGVIISNVTLHNMNFIKEKDIRIGDRVIVGRAGDVIPTVIKSLFNYRKGNNTFTVIIPKYCPVCDTGVRYNLSKAAAYCPIGWLCMAQLKERLKHFTSRKVMNMQGFGHVVIDQLVDLAIVKNLSDLYLLTEDDLLTLKCVGGKLSKKLVGELQKRFDIPLEKFIFAMCIKGIGERKAIEIAKHFNNLSALYTHTVNVLDLVKDVGENSLLRVKEFFNNHSNTTLYHRNNKNIVETRDQCSNFSHFFFDFRKIYEVLKIILSFRLNSHPTDPRIIWS